MAGVFNAAGIAAVAVDGGTDEAARVDAPIRLPNREINFIFAVDIFN